MSGFFNSDFVNDFITIWVIVDPIAALPVFIALTAGYDRAMRTRVAAATALIALAVLVFFICLGQVIIEAMGVSLRSFQIAGGLILFVFAVDLVIGQGKQVGDSDTAHESAFQRAVYPLAIPNLAGPGAMLTVILRTDNSRLDVLEQLHTATSVALVLGIAFVLMLLAGPITRLIGIGGANVLKRIMGMIIAAYAANLVVNGIGSWLKMPPL